jgi:putative hydrolases of HD superfamily
LYLESFVSIEWLPAVLDKVNDLKQLPRTGWLLAGVRAPESIADHCLATALLALFLADAINLDWAGQGLTGPLDCALVLRIALLHDLAESSLTDLPKRSSDLIGRTVKHQAEERALQQLFAQTPAGADYVQLWAAYASGETPEARLVRDADKLEMIHQALRYTAQGQRNLQEFYQRQPWSFPLTAALFEQLSHTQHPPKLEEPNHEAG